MSPADTVVAVSLVLPWGEMAFGALCVAVVVTAVVDGSSALALWVATRRAERNRVYAGRDPQRDRLWGQAARARRKARRA